jgi:replicative DNA helicase
MTDPFNPGEEPHGVYDAGEAVGLTLDSIDQREQDILSGKAVAGLFGLETLDDYVVTQWPGDVLVICALPSNGKSFVSRMLAKRVVDVLLEHGDGSRVVVWVTVEESIEKVTTHWLAAMSGISATDMLSGKMKDIQKGRMRASVAEVSSWPFYIIGHSIARREEDGEKHKTARLSRDEIDMCLDYIMNTAKKDIAFVVIDYLHRVRNDKGSDREEHIRKTVDWTRDVAIWTGCPVVLAAQAKYKVAERKYPMPNLAEVEWSMNAGQTADAFFGLWMPKTSIGVGGMVEDFGGFKNLVVTDDMCFIGIGKQKDGPAGKVFLIKAKPHLMTWNEMIIERVNLNDPQAHGPGGLPEMHPDDEKAGRRSQRQAARNWPSSQEKIPF